MDVGLDSFVALSNGMEIDNPRHLKRGLPPLRRAQRGLPRRKRGSHRRRKAATLVAKAHRKIRNQRAAFHHDLSRWLVERYGLIAVEDLNIKGLSRGILAGPVHDAGWNSFFAKLWYKAASAGRELVKVDPRGTSQVCVCGAAVPKTLAERWHECPACGLSAPRDVVSAQVILQRARIGRSRHNVEDVASCVRSEEHTSEPQSQSNLVCRLLLEKKKLHMHSGGGDGVTDDTVGRVVVLNSALVVRVLLSSRCMHAHTELRIYCCAHPTQAYSLPF